MISYRKGARMEAVPLAPPSTCKLQVGGRLAFFKEEWKYFSNDWASSVVSNGFTIPLLGHPPNLEVPEFYGSLDQRCLVENHIKDLLEKKAVIPVSPDVAEGGVTSP